MLSVASFSPAPVPCLHGLPPAPRQYSLPGVLDGEGVERAAPRLSLPLPEREKANGPQLRTYQVRCRRDLYRTLNDQAGQAGATITHLVRSALGMLTRPALDSLSDPGAPRPADSHRVGHKVETPVLRLRLPVGLTVVEVRKVLGFIAELSEGALHVVPRTELTTLHRRIGEQSADIERLREGFALIAFEPLPNGVRSRFEALHVLRFPPGAEPKPEEVTARFRALAAVLHPDARLVNDHTHMVQLIEARKLLQRIPAPSRAVVR